MSVIHRPDAIQRKRYSSLSVRSFGAVGVALLLLLGVGACGSSPDKPSSGTAKASPSPSAAAARVKAPAWMESVCNGVIAWTLSVAGVSLIAIGVDENGTDPAKAKADLGKALASSLTSTDAAVKILDNAGVPDVTGGEKIAQEFRASLIEGKAGLTTAQSELKNTDTQNKAAFFDELTSITDQLTDSYDKVSERLKNAKSAEMSKQIDPDADCTTD